MNKSKLTLLVLILLLPFSVFSQSIGQDDEKNKESILQEEAIKYLRETVSDVNALRTSENRISFYSELANLMWFYDEKEARRMFTGVADNFVQLLSEYNSRVEAYGGVRDENELYRGFSMSSNPRSDAIRKLYKATEVREQIALAIAEHDGQLGFDFVVRTSSIVTDKTLAETFVLQNERLEQKILQRMGVRDVKASLEFGRKSLKRGFNSALVNLAMKVFVKDPEAAREFGEELVSKVKSEADTTTESFTNFVSILDAGSNSEEAVGEGKKPLFEKNALKELAELFAVNLMNAEKLDFYSRDEYVSQIEKYAPTQASRLRAKFDAEDTKSGKKEDDDSADPPMENFAAPVPSAESAADEARQKEQLEFMSELKNLGEGKLSDEQKAEFMSKSRRIVAGMEEPMMKVMALSSLAAQVKKIGDEKLASEIMREANALLKSNPRNFVDYILLWSVATGYAEVEPDRSFPLIEDAIFRLNDTIGAMIKVAEFVDVQNEFVINGEVQLGVFGGSMTRNVVGTLSNSSNVLRNLAEADFDRTKALADKFEIPEVRLLAKFLILRSVLANDESTDMGLIN